MQEIIKQIKHINKTKIVLCVMDGLGGIPVDGKTELQAADSPNLDALANQSECGLHIPVARGITPGSGAAHLGLFGYDPVKNEIGRGVLEALGLGIDIGPHDIAIRGNFATVEYKDDNNPVVTDRRAGRIPTEENKRIIKKITYEISEIDGVKIKLYSGLEHRFVVVLSFQEKVSPEYDLINDTDPQETGKSPLLPAGKNEKSSKVANIVKKLVEEIARVIRDEERANYILLRGFSAHPQLKSYEEIYGLNACCIATYPMYKGVSKLVGMDILDVEGTTISSEVDTLKREFAKYDFFYMHIKKTDSYGEDGNFKSKVGVIEEFDSLLAEIQSLKPDVIAITGDHSTPAKMKSHSWHPVPLLIYSENCRNHKLKGFYEEECHRGELGVINSTEIMPLLMAHAGRLGKFGA